MSANILIHEALCFALFYTVFCRAVRSNDKVKTDVRIAFFFLGAAAIMGMVAPLVWAHNPKPWDLGLLAAVVFVQAITAKHWSGGVPELFLQEHHRPRNRRMCDSKGTP
jgi:hypothetical protein